MRTSAVVLLVLASSVVNLAVNPYSFTDQNVSVSTNAEKTSPASFLEQTTENSMGEPVLNSENSTPDEQVATQNGTLKGDDSINSTSLENPVDSRIGGLSNETIQSAIVPLPDGRIFYRGEPPYGYLPTSCPKENVGLPPLPFEPD